MTSTQPEILNSIGEDDSRETPPVPVTSGRRATPLTERNSQRNKLVRRMADPDPRARTPSTNSQQSQNNLKAKRSRSSSPFSTVPQEPPSKKRMTTPPIKPWIKQEHIFKEFQDKLSLYGLGPYDLPVTSDKWLPFNVQSKILIRTQNVLEEALFEFLYRNWIEICVENGWEEMGEAELNELAPAMIAGLQAHQDDIKELIDYENSQISDSLSFLLEKSGQIRHCAVHRTKKIPVIIVEFMVRDASYITMYLKDNERTKILDGLCRPLEPLSFNLQARFGDKLQGKVERKLQRANAEIEKMREALRVEEERERQGQLQLQHILAQDEGTYEEELEALKKVL